MPSRWRQDIRCRLNPQGETRRGARESKKFFSKPAATLSSGSTRQRTPVPLLFLLSAVQKIPLPFVSHREANSQRREARRRLSRSFVLNRRGFWPVPRQSRHF